VTRIWKERLNVPENAGFFFRIFFTVDDRDSTFQMLQIIAAYLFIKIDQYLMPAPIIERQSEGVV
jgi:hypothetical protein